MIRKGSNESGSGSQDNNLDSFVLEVLLIYKQETHCLLGRYNQNINVEKLGPGSQAMKGHSGM